MPIQRFRGDVDRTRLVAGWIFIALAVWLGAWVLQQEFRAGRINITGLVFDALVAGIFYMGWRLTRPRDLFDIDLQNRTYTAMRKGIKAGSGPLDALGPLEVQKRIVTSGTSRDPRSRIMYVVTPATHSKVDLYSERTAGKARRKMESLARAWHLSCRSLGGAVRGPDELDVPLFERLREDADARAPADLRPDWGVRIEALPRGYAMRSTLRSYAPMRSSGFILLAMLFIVFRGGTSGLQMMLASLENEAGDLMTQVLCGLFGIVMLVFLWMIATGVRDTFFPGTVGITDQGVAYRGSRIAFRQIEEVTATHPIEVIGDRKSLTLGQTFCAPGAAKAVAHEIQRLIIEVAESNPHSR
jgi:hypothetical protein